jgi:UDP-N-acetylmuramate dehydrogenase
MNDAAFEIPGCVLTHDASLRERTTFRVPARAARLIEVTRSDALATLFSRDEVLRDEILVLGGGSNVLFTRDWPGVVVSILTRGIEIVEDRGDASLVRCAAGENWNGFVHWSLAQGFAGLENLALIPGCVGAAPIQNIGAYGAEVREFIHAVEVFDRESRSTKRLSNAACAFAYRDSLFKRQAGRYVIVSVDFLLARTHPLRLDYAGVHEELAALGVTTPDASAVARAIVCIRTRKLPDPAVVGNAGSFFKNPVVTQAQANTLRASFANLPQWPASDSHAKLSAAWLIESCNFKGLREQDVGVSTQHALVLVNYGNASGAQIWALAQRIQNRVFERFGVRLEPEPLVI